MEMLLHGRETAPQGVVDTGPAAQHAGPCAAEQGVVGGDEPLELGCCRFTAV